MPIASPNSPSNFEACSTAKLSEIDNPYANIPISIDLPQISSSSSRPTEFDYNSINLLNALLRQGSTTRIVHVGIMAKSIHAALQPDILYQGILLGDALVGNDFAYSVMTEPNTISPKVLRCSRSIHSMSCWGNGTDPRWHANTGIR